MEARRLGAENSVPFIKLPVLLDASNSRKWMFLEDLGVRHVKDQDFYLELLTSTIASRKSIDLAYATKVYATVANVAQTEKQVELR